MMVYLDMGKMKELKKKIEELEKLPELLKDAEELGIIKTYRSMKEAALYLVTMSFNRVGCNSIPAIVVDSYSDMLIDSVRSTVEKMDRISRNVYRVSLNKLEEDKLLILLRQALSDPSLGQNTLDAQDELRSDECKRNSLPKIKKFQSIDERKKIVLEALAKFSRPVTVKELREHLGLHKTVTWVYKVVNELEVDPNKKVITFEEKGVKKVVLEHVFYKWLKEKLREDFNDREFTEKDIVEKYGSFFFYHIKKRVIPELLKNFDLEKYDGKFRFLTGNLRKQWLEERRILREVIK